MVNLYVKYTQRMRDEVGAKFQLVAWKPSADYEGVIGVWNTATHATIANVDTQAVVYWTTGAHAGVAVNKSLTNAKYDGELILDTEYTQAALEAALKAGKFMFHNVNGVTRVLEDINTLLTLSDTKGEVFSPTRPSVCVTRSPMTRRCCSTPAMWAPCPMMPLAVPPCGAMWSSSSRSLRKSVLLRTLTLTR